MSKVVLIPSRIDVCFPRSKCFTIESPSETPRKTTLAKGFVLPLGVGFLYEKVRL